MTLEEAIILVTAVDALAEARESYRTHLAKHKTADAHDCAEMEEEYQRVKAERDEARARVEEQNSALTGLAREIGRLRAIIPEDLIRELEEARAEATEEHKLRQAQESVSMGLADKLIAAEAEVERLRAGIDEQEAVVTLEAHVHEVDRAEKAEAEVERLRIAAVHNPCGIHDLMDEARHITALAPAEREEEPCECDGAPYPHYHFWKASK